MASPAKRKVEVITGANKARVKQEFEDSLLRCYRTSRFLIPRMNLDFKVWFQEVYSSVVGEIFCYTPFWRGRTFTDCIMMHESSHWTIYPVDLFRGLRDLFTARSLLAKDAKFTPKVKETDLYGRVEDWTNFPYSVKEIQFIQNVLGDYLVNSYLHDYHPELFKVLWDFLYHEGTFYERQKQLKRDTTFLLYLSVYPKMFPKLQSIQLLDPKTEEDSLRIEETISEVKQGRMSNPFAVKELAKVFHPYLEKDSRDSKEGEGGEPPKCPNCGHEEFEVVAYEDPETGKWVEA